MKKKIISIILAVLILSVSIPLSVGAENPTAAPELNLDCKSAILMEASTGTVLYEKDADIPMPPASVTKIMTLLLVMEQIEKGALRYEDTVTASANACSMGGK